MAIISFGSKGAQALARLWDLFVLNILWLLGSLPVVTLGLSSIAAYRVTLKMVEDEDVDIAREFFRAYRESLAQGLLLSVLLLFFCASAALSVFLFEAVPENPILLLILGFGIGVTTLIHFLYVFPLAARYRNGWFQHILNAREIFFHFFAKTLACLLLLGFEIWLFFFNGLLLMYVGFFVAPILGIATVSSFAMKIFREIEKAGGVLEPVAAGHV